VTKNALVTDLKIQPFGSWVGLTSFGLDRAEEALSRRKIVIEFFSSNTPPTPFSFIAQRELL
jgi:hypothetical protein